jgi:hypothetical protein
LTLKLQSAKWLMVRDSLARLPLSASTSPVRDQPPRRMIGTSHQEFHQVDFRKKA